MLANLHKNKELHNTNERSVVGETLLIRGGAEMILTDLQPPNLAVGGLCHLMATAAAAAQQTPQTSLPVSQQASFTLGGGKFVHFRTTEYKSHLGSNIRVALTGFHILCMS